MQLVITNDIFVIIGGLLAWMVCTVLIFAQASKKDRATAPGAATPVSTVDVVPVAHYIWYAELNRQLDKLTLDSPWPKPGWFDNWLPGKPVTAPRNQYVAGQLCYRTPMEPKRHDIHPDRLYSAADSW